MSDPSQAYADFIIQAVRFTRISRYPVVAGYTALLYEFLIVFDQEYRLIYKSQWTLLKFLYLACRFIPITLWPVNIFTFMNEHTRQACQPLVVFFSLSFAPFLALPQCVYVLRAWSITGRKTSLLAIFSSCLAAYLGIVLWASTDDLRVIEAGFNTFGKAGCYRGSYRHQNPFARSIFAGIVLDFIVATIMMIYYYLTIRGSRGRLGRLVLKQDMFFFPFMLALNAWAAIMFLSPIRFLDGIVFTSVFVTSNILTCRFILQLRGLSSPTEHTELIRLSGVVRRDLGPASAMPNFERSNRASIALPVANLEPVPSHSHVSNV
ncbi:hypothetical protein CPB83DRAFT_910972 [Crepidotus variabilis]|uniref:DUF6533 domain-containing protein n=1 Tax=Crepidotus variabilis TaxID=179855 RepID=A0A9P6E5Q8_9AGAR|nr:hypothetical protein CPB83DRAFT_910972 [Crepidotus variabilis]